GIPGDGSTAVMLGALVLHGIQPGVLYELVYTAKEPKVTGLGLAAIRDAVSFFRYESRDDSGQRNPLAGLRSRSRGRAACCRPARSSGSAGAAG
ncbi:MAG: hypothetical protein ACU85V_18755, partial [Gammaproteobacteria bacterium]